MTPETEEFLNLVRHAENPSEEDEQRVLRALQASVAAGLTTNVAVGAWRPTASLAKSTSAWSGAIAKLSLVAVGTSLGLGLPPDFAAKPPAATCAVPMPPQTAQLPVPTLASPPPAPAPSSSEPPNRPAGARSLPVPSLRSELRILEQAQRALKAGDGESALRALDAAGVVDGPLREDRQAARILALCHAGREGEARSAVARFLENYPESAHRAAIAAGCANFQWFETR